WGGSSATEPSGFGFGVLCSSPGADKSVKSGPQSTSMAERADQLFVNLLHAALEWLPEPVRGIAGLVVSIGAILAVFGLLFGLTTVCERKAIARMQNRLG